MCTATSNQGHRRNCSRDQVDWYYDDEYITIKIIDFTDIRFRHNILENKINECCNLWRK